MTPIGETLCKTRSAAAKHEEPAAASLASWERLRGRRESQAKIINPCYNAPEPADGAAAMTQTQMIEGTTEEITRQLQQSYAGQTLRVFIEREDSEDLAAGIPAPPFTVRDQAHLEELLLEGLKGPFSEFTDESVAAIRQEVHRRHATR